MALLIQSLVREALRAHCLYDTDLPHSIAQQHCHRAVVAGLLKFLTGDCRPQSVLQAGVVEKAPYRAACDVPDWLMCL